MAAMIFVSRRVNADRREQRAIVNQPSPDRRTDVANIAACSQRSEFSCSDAQLTES